MSERLEDIISFRKEKIKSLIAQGVLPYPSLNNRTYEISNLLEQFEEGVDYIIVGRIRSLRTMGKLVFAHIEDGNGRMQVLFKADNGKEKFDFFIDHFDLGDFIEIKGRACITKTGERTLEVLDYLMLAKSILPLPSEHFGIHDEEIKLRKRYLDILLDKEVKDLFVKKAKFWQSFRNFLLDDNYIEMYMPILEPTTGGAEAMPFVTHHNALDEDFYLRISLELPLKKMLVAGYEKVFEIGRIFRNEGISATHLQDYTQLEFYWAYGDFDRLMKMAQEMYQKMILDVFGTLIIKNDIGEVDWSGEWERVSYVELFKSNTGIDLLTCSDDDLKKYADDHKLNYEKFAQRGRIIDIIFKSIRGQLGQKKPIFLIDQPIELEPLAKKVDNNEKIVQRFQIIAYGTELGKGFGELNDPIDQVARFEAQSKLREAGDDEAQMMDEDYVEAMEYGMPPAAGFGTADRLFAVLTGRSVREIVVFPPMRKK